MKITNAMVFVELDNTKELRQLFITKEMTKVLISMIEAGAFHKEDVTISDKICEVLRIKDEDN